MPSDYSDIGENVVAAAFRPLVKRKIVGATVGLIVRNEKAIYTYGRSDATSENALPCDSIFEIGSITKVFTGVLLAQMVHEREVHLNDPVAKFLPRFPDAQGKYLGEITLLDLATHTSGLPRLPRNFFLVAHSHPLDPYSQYTVRDLDEAFQKAKPRVLFGKRFHYSNFGFGLLGYVLERAAGKSYEALIIERICRPLHMTETAIHLSSGLNMRQVQGHGRRRKPVPDWHFSALEGAGALRSTVPDMVRFLCANLKPETTPIASALRMAQYPQRPIKKRGASIGLGWIIRRKEGYTVVWHNGGTGGFGSFIGLDRDVNIGLVCLSNSRHSRKLDRSGFHVLNRLAKQVAT